MYIFILHYDNIAPSIGTYNLRKYGKRDKKDQKYGDSRGTYIHNKSKPSELMTPMNLKSNVIMSY